MPDLWFYSNKRLGTGNHQPSVLSTTSTDSTDYVYPGAMHTRFEHSLGVMHIAAMLYERIAQNSREILKTTLGYNDDGLKRDRTLVRLTALLHDIGHAPFSHASEELFPLKSEDADGKRYKHEDYSAQIVRQHFQDIITHHPLNRNYGFEAENTSPVCWRTAPKPAMPCSGEVWLSVRWVRIEWIIC